MNRCSTNVRRDDAVRFLLGRIDYERRAPVPYEARYFKLDRMKKLLKELGDPQRDLPVLHIAGSKGKGSVAAMIAAALMAHGARVGLFTSPHLVSLEERLAINGQACPPEIFADLVQEITPAVERLDRAAPAVWGQPTFFEIVTSMAMRYFADQQVDAAVLETGLGGRLDATNVCHPRVTVITSISRDHTQQLGNSLAAIAREKAGIIKPGIPLVTGVVDDEPMQVIRQRCRELRSPHLQIGREFDCRRVSLALEGTSFDYLSDVSHGSRRLQTSLIGRHQAGNAAIAVAALEQWFAHESPDKTLAWDATESGLESVRCPARFEVLNVKPPVVLDAAHNEASIRAMIETAETTFPGRRWTVVFGTSADKEIAPMLSRLVPWAARLIITRYQSNPRGADVGLIERLARGVAGCHGASIEVCPSPLAAWTSAQEAAGDGAICVTGSFFLAAELRPSMATLPAAGAARDGREPPSGGTL